MYIYVERRLTSMQGWQSSTPSQACWSYSLSLLFLLPFAQPSLTQQLVGRRQLWSPYCCFRSILDRERCVSLLWSSYCRFCFVLAIESTLLV